MADIKRLRTALDQIGELLPGIRYRVGGKSEIERHDSPPRIVMEPRGFVLEPNHGAAGALFTRVETVRAHIWGKDMEQVEELQELLANAVVKVAGWSIQGGSGEWNDDGILQKGAVATLDLSFKIPVMRRHGRAPLVLAEPLGTEFVSHDQEQP